jgi:hypothetical protein
MEEVFAVRNNHIALKTVALDQVSDVDIAHQFIP